MTPIGNDSGPSGDRGRDPGGDHSGNQCGPNGPSLSPADHDRKRHERDLVYPVLSRRAGGLSVGINLNPGRECNWACAYCEVDGLVRGTPGPVDIEKLSEELDEVLLEARTGRWDTEDGPRGAAAVRDISIAGDGEPTLSPVLAEAIDAVAGARARHGLTDTCDLVIITNGSRVHRPEVLAALGAFGGHGGKLWFKLDVCTPVDAEFMNGAPFVRDRVLENLKTAAAAAPTWIQSMALAIDGRGPSEAAVEHVKSILVNANAAGADLQGVLLYGLARPSHQPGADRLSALDPKELAKVAQALRASGLPVSAFV